ncbi:MAG: sigma 54-interacting transcriptional regulator [Kiritimatiellae bacterium]|nr:sigma 54-interacting transcriptional regulator [Kiritimatiellia bacterium]
MPKEKSTKSQDVQPKRKVLISFISYDQDDFEVKKTDESFMKSYLLPDDRVPQSRHEIWRPSVALAQLQGLEEHYDDLVFDDYYLLTDNRDKHKKVKEEVIEDIRHVAPTLNLVVDDPRIKNPFDTYEVYQRFVEYFSDEKFHRANTEYYVNCTSGTSQIRNCLFLLTQMGQIDARRIDPTPWRNHKQRGKKKDNQYKEDGRRWVKGSYKIDDPREFTEACRKTTESTDKGTLGFLKYGVTTKDYSKLEKIAHIIDKIKEIKNPKLRAQQSILLTGETGVGKTQMARNIADAFMGRRDKKNFISLNCAMIRGSDANIQRMELFGNKKGFPNANDQEKPGVFSTANGKILFLDEIGELHPTIQAMLLAVLDVDDDGNFNFVPLGGDPSKPEKSSFMLICGTNRPLEQQLEENASSEIHFRSDLFNRINAWHFELAPLRERREDIPENVDSILNEFYADTNGKRPLFKPTALKKFLDFAKEEKCTTWDGNFRELNAIVRRMAILAVNNTITDEIVEEEIKAAQKQYEAKRQRSASAVEETARQATMEAPRQEEKEEPHQERDHHSIIGDDTYKSLSLLDQAEFDILAKTVMEDRVTDRQELIEKVYGIRTSGKGAGKLKLSSGGLTHRLSNKFNLRLVKGKLVRIENPQPPAT